ncbi:Quinohemoprotein alcohol dehydrogenase ADH IIB precursor [Variovorax sp. SRS16]|uniref:PQQ-dependent dehydrogenase, methanol/ethanol family n=1 Tax=Variovorax sp. SRS16 TaxID=282217 RepID=UPI00131848BA|nr:PQQ-dependent dehydrogenase, methanol/ethanol family [Variovorax sp. SRS16]VTU14461.1 Quinohemoprotein alcohol dehydrogenase ADH IIB precursor [Variovorax sp. SRS16]
MTSFRPGFVLAAVLALGAAAPQHAMAAPGFTPIGGEDLARPKQGGDEWLAAGRTYTGTFSSPLATINAKNVAKLGLAWHLDLPTDRGLEATPLVADGVMYFSLPWGHVMAVDARTGKEIWHYDPGAVKQVSKDICCDAVNRGVALWGDKVFVGVIDGRLVALDRATGKVAWEVQTVDRTKPYTITGQPLVMKNIVVIGNSGADFGARGYITAYDVNSGKQLWRFFIVPGDPSKPYEHEELAMAAKTWKGDSYWKNGGGGGNAWGNMNYDPELDLLYVGTGNGSPWNREIRSPGGGDNLFLSSILAIRPATGKLVWYYQTTPGESWDYTATANMVLADLKIKGRQRKVLMQLPKNGFYYVLDRATGELLSADKVGKVTWASKVDMKTGRPVEEPGVRYEKKPIVMWPGPYGAHSWQPMALSRKTGLVYIPYQEMAGAYRNEGADFVHRPSNFNTGSAFYEGTSFPKSFASGALIAWDPVQRKVVWKVPHESVWNGGALVTDGNLVFQGNAFGKFVAYAADTGKTLWDFDAQTGIIASASTYMIDGDQYVALLAGWGGGAPMVGGEADNFTGVRNVSRLLVFKLGGSDKLPPLAPQVVSHRVPTGTDASAAVIANGNKDFGIYCAKCHGVGGESGGLVPDLRRSPMILSAEAFRVTVTDGREPRGMPSFSTDLKPREIEEIRAYLLDKEMKDFGKPTAGK